MYNFVGEGRVKWGGWIRWGACLILSYPRVACLVEKIIKAAMLIFWYRHPMTLSDKPQCKQTQISLCSRYKQENRIFYIPDAKNWWTFEVSRTSSIKADNIWSIKQTLIFIFGSIIICQ